MVLGLNMIDECILSKMIRVGAKMQRIQSARGPIDHLIIPLAISHMGFKIT